jgi:hypothetical protein
MTLQEAKSIARHLGLTLRKVRSGAYRVNFRDGNETTAYYTDNLEDVVTTVVEMVRTRGVVQAVDKTVATGTVPRRIADMPIDLNAVRRGRSDNEDHLTNGLGPAGGNAGLGRRALVPRHRYRRPGMDRSRGREQ